MPRYRDDWVVDRTMFEYVSGGSCACCGFSHLFYPNGVAGLIQSISDFETDTAQAEVSALQTSPWPPEMREQIWGDRVRLRYKMKQEMHVYKEFWDTHGEGFSTWCRNNAGVTTMLKKTFQMPRSGITERLHSHYGIHSAYAVVLCTVVEQVSKIKMTQYPADARGCQAELDFEEALLFDRRGGFTLDMFANSSDGTLLLQEHGVVLDVWLERMKTLGGPKLLERGPSTSHNDDNEGESQGGTDDQEGNEKDTAAGPSFRGDRRIVRLLIARYWADMMMKQYQKHLLDETNDDHGVANDLLEQSMADKLSLE